MFFINRFLRQAWSIRWGVCLSALICLGGGCDRGQVRVYDVPKEQPETAPMASPHGGMSPHGTIPTAPMPPRLHWTLPQGWTEKAPEAMRAATFVISGGNGLDADVAVIPLPGVTAEDSQIVNLWLDQLQLKPVTEDDLGKLEHKVPVADQEGRLFDLVSEDALIQDREKARILVAMVEVDGINWFFKMTGPATLVGDQKEAFEEFLKSVSFEADPHAGMAMGAASGGMPPMASGSAEAGLPAWNVPADWHETPPPNMILARFVAGDPEGAQADVTISAFPGSVGGLLANVNRWRVNQLGLTAVNEDELGRVVEEVDVLGGRASLVDMTGTDSKSGQPARMVAMVVPRSERTWFYKLMGVGAVVESQKESFVQFVQTVKYSDAD